MNGSAGSKAIAGALLLTALLSPSVSESARAQEKPAIWIRVMDEADMAKGRLGKAGSTLVVTGPAGKVLVVEADQNDAGLFKVEFEGAGLYELTANAPGCEKKIEKFGFSTEVKNKRIGLVCESPGQAETPPEGTAQGKQPSAKEEPVDQPSGSGAWIAKPSGTIPRDVVVELRHGPEPWNWRGVLMAFATTIVGVVFFGLAVYAALTTIFRKPPSKPGSLDDEMEGLRFDLQQLEQTASARQQEGARAGAAASAASDVVPDLNCSAVGSSPDRLTEHPAQARAEAHRPVRGSRDAQEPAAAMSPRWNQSFDRRPVSQGLLDDYQQARIGGDGSQAAERFKNRFNGIRLSLVNADAILQSPVTRAEFREASRGYFLAVEERGEWKCLPWFSYELSDPTFRVVFDCTGQDGARVVLPLTLVRNGDVWTADGRGRIA
jgi:hypothetical protein